MGKIKSIIKELIKAKKLLSQDIHSERIALMHIQNAIDKLQLFKNIEISKIDT